MENIGNQEITFRYKQEATSEGFNKLLYNVTEHGIIEGGELEYNYPTLTINPFSAIIKDNAKNIAVKITTSEKISLTTSSLNNYIVGDFDWVNVENNYMQFTTTNATDVKNHDICFGKMLFTSENLPLSVDTTCATYSLDYYLKNHITNNLRIKTVDNCSVKYPKIVVEKGKFIYNNKSYILDVENEYNCIPNTINYVVATFSDSVIDIAITTEEDFEKLNNCVLLGLIDLTVDSYASPLYIKQYYLYPNVDLTNDVETVLNSTSGRAIANSVVYNVNKKIEQIDSNIEQLKVNARYPNPITKLTDSDLLKREQAIKLGHANIGNINQFNNSVLEYGANNTGAYARTMHVYNLNKLYAAFNSINKLCYMMIASTEAELLEEYRIAQQSWYHRPYNLIWNKSNTASDITEVIRLLVKNNITRDIILYYPTKTPEGGLSASKFYKTNDNTGIDIEQPSYWKFPTITLEQYTYLSIYDGDEIVTVYAQPYGDCNPYCEPEFEVGDKKVRFSYKESLQPRLTNLVVADNKKTAKLGISSDYTLYFLHLNDSINITVDNKEVTLAPTTIEHRCYWNAQSTYSGHTHEKPFCKIYKNPSLRTEIWNDVGVTSLGGNLQFGPNLPGFNNQYVKEYQGGVKAPSVNDTIVQKTIVDGKTVLMRENLGLIDATQVRKQNLGEYELADLTSKPIFLDVLSSNNLMSSLQIMEMCPDFDYYPTHGIFTTPVLTDSLRQDRDIKDNLFTVGGSEEWRLKARQFPIAASNMYGLTFMGKLIQRRVYFDIRSDSISPTITRHLVGIQSIHYTAPDAPTGSTISVSLFEEVLPTCSIENDSPHYRKEIIYNIRAAGVESIKLPEIKSNQKVKIIFPVPYIISNKVLPGTTSVEGLADRYEQPIKLSDLRFSSNGVSIVTSGSNILEYDYETMPSALIFDRDWVVNSPVFTSSDCVANFLYLYDIVHGTGYYKGGRGKYYPALVTRQYTIKIIITEEDERNLVTAEMGWPKEGAYNEQWEWEDSTYEEKAYWNADRQADLGCFPWFIKRC